MLRRPLVAHLLVVALIAAFAGTAAFAQTGTTSLGSARLPRAVVANGQPLAAGTYTIRLTNESPSAVVGQTPAESRWVEFVQGGQVKGKEVATVLTGEEAKSVVKGKRPAAGAAQVELLKGEEYVRVWVNRGGTNYLVHLAVAK
ncbi:MAG TPA: hypothetical protein VFO19_08765 [Vicinamibacterales bacterium]|jgi:hypothetical protein|nr:hypothetical protein [Vicinamibacterales bacterium]